MSVPGICVTDPKAAQCGEVLKGVLKPHECKLFGKECTPEHPIGALMVSLRRRCAAHFKYASWRLDTLEAAKFRRTNPARPTLAYLRSIR